jgi:hypothetical protein
MKMKEGWFGRADLVYWVVCCCEHIILISSYYDEDDKGECLRFAFVNNPVHLLV